MALEPSPPWLNDRLVRHAQVLLNSFVARVGRELIARHGDPLEEATRLYTAPRVVVSHGTQADPVLNYGNRAALELWETDFATLTQMPSRLTAEPLHRDERARLLERTARDGFVDDYRGIRISSRGRRFLIEQAIVWNLESPDGEKLGQAATFDQWTMLKTDEAPG
ncbi:MAG: MEKHLA domain-containing protein [Pirellula sp.]|nr:MEKHLA domain-containing protein [Pirellula sp.]